MLVMVGFELNQKVRPLVQFVYDNNMQDNVAMLGYVPEDVLAALYRKALALIFPSFYEGFGLPVLEAMKSGTAVVAADIPPVREVANDAALFFKPQDNEAMVDALFRIVENKVLRQRLAEWGLKQAEKFSWSETAQKTLDLYKELS
jgi:glycosyltransferase involved in cell wall biosynthesis